MLYSQTLTTVDFVPWRPLPQIYIYTGLACLQVGTYADPVWETVAALRDVGADPISDTGHCRHRRRSDYLRALGFSYLSQSARLGNAVIPTRE